MPADGRVILFLRRARLCVAVGGVKNSAWRVASPAYKYIVCARRNCVQSCFIQFAWECYVLISGGEQCFTGERVKRGL